MKNRVFLAALAAFLIFFGIQIGHSQTEAAAFRQLDSLEKSWQWQRGKIDFPTHNFSIQTPDGLRFLPSDQSRFVLENLWDNATDATTLGLFFSENASPLDSSVFAVEVKFDEIGQVSQTDLSNFEASFLLESLQNDQKKLNLERQKQGLLAIEITDWALPPTLGAGNRWLFWAKKLKIEGDQGPERVSSEARVLGKKGCVAFNALGSMTDFGRLQKAVESLAAVTTFLEKAEASSDKKSAWSMAGLVAGRAFSRPIFLNNFWKIAVCALVGFGLFGFSRKRKEGRKTI